MKYFALVLIVCSVMALSACGKRGPLEPPPGGNPNYPHQYPQQ